MIFFKILNFLLHLVIVLWFLYLWWIGDMWSSRGETNFSTTLWFISAGIIFLCAIFYMFKRNLFSYALLVVLVIVSWFFRIVVEWSSDMPIFLLIYTLIFWWFAAVWKLRDHKNNEK